MLRRYLSTANFSQPSSRYTFLLVLLVIGACGYSTSPGQDQDIAPPATTVQLPVFGVRVDPSGLFEVKRFAEPGGHLFVQRAMAARIRMPKPLVEASGLRKVSLRHLELALAERIANGQEPTDEMLHLAGLTGIDFLFVYPESNDIVIVGPAEGWVHDAADRACGMFSGRPTVLLEDLLVALRSFRRGVVNHWVGCSIGPSADSLARLHEVQRALPRSIPQAAEGQVAMEVLRAVEQALGLANISVFGVSPKTHMAQVMVEADYRMKLIAIGREPPPIDMPTFFSEMKRPIKNSLQRWWFTPDYQRLVTAPDGLSLQFTGAQVRLGTEDYRISAQGAMTKVDTDPPRPSRLYASAFTRRYDEIATMSPVFAQLRNCVDLLVAAAFIENQNLYQLAGWVPELLLDDQQLPTEKLIAPLKAPFMANVAWRNRHLIAPSGGVSILASQALTQENLIVREDVRVGQVREAIQSKLAKQVTWWWD